MAPRLTLALLISLALSLAVTSTAICQVGGFKPPTIPPTSARTANQPAAPTPRTTLGSTPKATLQSNAAAVKSAAATAREHFAKVTSGSDMLPRTAGQVWRKYDISSYTARIPEDPNAQQTIIDWIIRETGDEIWHNAPLGILSASRETLQVYHTPEVQEIVHNLVDRFVHPGAESTAIAIRLVTIGSPNWRSKAFPLLASVDVQTPGVQAWLVTKENAAILAGELRKRSDFQEHQTPNYWIPNGISKTIARATPKTFIQAMRPTDAGWPFQPVMGTINEGYSLQISPLMDTQGRSMEVVIKCNVDQVEKFDSIQIDIPGYGGQQTQRAQVQVPQVSSWRLHERFRWPVDQILLLSCGVVATPGPEKNNILGIPNPFDSTPGRADALLFIEARSMKETAILQGVSGRGTTPVGGVQR